jgi:hypothetical protein
VNHRIDSDSGIDPRHTRLYLPPAGESARRGPRLARLPPAAARVVGVDVQRVQPVVRSEPREGPCPWAAIRVPEGIMRENR